VTDTTENRLPKEHRGPGLVDLQVNGYAGFDFNSIPDGWRASDFVHMRDAMAGRGVVMSLLTLITAAPDRLVAGAAGYARILAEAPELEAAFPKLHIEGPFISADDGPRGAHPREHCTTPREHPDLLERVVEASGDRIGILTIAPELAGALDLISKAASLGICVAIGHTQADPTRIAEAVAAGARMSTHVGNGSHQILPRHENYIQAQLAEDRLAASFIADGHHLPWYVLKNYIRAKTVEHTVLITDCMAAADVGAGKFPLGDYEVDVSEDLRVTRPGKPGFAGSALTLDRAVMNVTQRCGVPFAEAWTMASTRPAALVGIETIPEVQVLVEGGGPGGAPRFTRTG
jgi:N-acetylglucosamine-6-phosphate deacetylase